MKDKAEKLYDAHCEHLGRGKRGHPHWDDLPHEERVQWRKVALALDEVPPPDDPNTGGPPADSDIPAPRRGIMR